MDPNTLGDFQIGINVPFRKLINYYTCWNNEKHLRFSDGFKEKENN